MCPPLDKAFSSAAGVLRLHLLLLHWEGESTQCKVGWAGKHQTSMTFRKLAYDRAVEGSDLLVPFFFCLSCCWWEQNGQVALAKRASIQQDYKCHKCTSHNSDLKSFNRCSPSTIHPLLTALCLFSTTWKLASWCLQKQTKWDVLLTSHVTFSA